MRTPHGEDSGQMHRQTIREFKWVDMNGIQCYSIQPLSQEHYEGITRMAARTFAIVRVWVQDESLSSEAEGRAG